MPSMTDLEVEPVESLHTTEAAEFILYGGKGGVGKTTMAAATGLASAAEGTQTLVVSTDPAHSLSDVYGESIPPEPTRLAEDDPLWAVEIDPDEAVASAGLFGTDEDVTMGGLGDLLGLDDDGVMPGADEAAALQQLLELMDDDRFDRVVVDTAPTGHTLRLLELPEAMDSLLGRFLKVREQFQGMLGNMPFGDDEAAAGPTMEEARERIERLRTVLRNPDRTDFRIVMVPETLSIKETSRLRNRLADYEIPVGTVVVNRVMEPPEEVGETGDLEFVTPDLQGCDFCARRWSVQQAAIQDAQDLFMNVDVRRVPLFADEVAGRDMLRIVASCLA